MSVASVLNDRSLEQRSVNALRVLSMDAIQRANSGHPGLPMGAADMAYVLWTQFLRFDPESPHWFNRDRFVLSGGHGSMLQYSLLHLLGFEVSLEDIKNFRQWGSPTPGHPEYGHTPGVDTTTGPLGQGISTAVGMALGEAHLSARLNRPGHTVVDHRTYVLATDGDMMEGVQCEAASLAGHWGLGKLIVLYDDNHITIDGSTDLAFTEDVGKRYEAYGWHVQSVDGHDRATVTAALQAATEETGKPSLIQARTHIALGSPHKQDTSDAHGSPLGTEEIALTKAAYGWPLEPAFLVPEDVATHFQKLGARHRSLRKTWEQTLADYGTAFPNAAAQWKSLKEDISPSEQGKPSFAPGEVIATRAASGKALAWLAQHVPFLWGGSADLAPSNKTFLSAESPFSREDHAGRNLHFGVREHGMAAILNGLALQGIRPYGGTFLVFADYMRPSIRMSALMNLPVVYVFTHDSIFLGEDGPTHQPISHLPALRTIPNLAVMRPCDAQETVEAWELALGRTGPTALILTRQGLPVLDRSHITGSLKNGAYVVESGGDNPEAIVFATGSEVSASLEAIRTLQQEGRAIRLVAIPSWELFDEQPPDYRQSILAPKIPVRISVEAGSTLGWERFTGLNGVLLGMNQFGASAPADVLAEKFGFTAEAIAQRLREALS